MHAGNYAVGRHYKIATGRRRDRRRVVRQHEGAGMLGDRPEMPRNQACLCRQFNFSWHRAAYSLVVQFSHSHPGSAGHRANVRIKGPLANISASGALDLTLASRVRGRPGSECQIRSTGYTMGLSAPSPRGNAVEAFDLYAPVIDADPFPYYAELRAKHP